MVIDKRIQEFNNKSFLMECINRSEAKKNKENGSAINTIKNKD